MKQRLLHLSERLRASFWLVPAVMMAAAILLAHGLLLLDQHLTVDHLPGLRWLKLRDPESARALLSIIAGSTITVAGTVFSITTVALTLAANQFGPHLVRNFIRDRGTQISLGIFLSTFVYALMVMRGIQSSQINGSEGNQSLAVSMALLLTLLCIAYLIYFIHNVAQSIQVDNITFHINREFRSALQQIYPTEESRDPRNSRVDIRDLNLGDDYLWVNTRSSGYVQLIDREKLRRWATDNDCCIHLECHPGTFLNHWSGMARVFDPPRTIDSETIAEAVRSAITVGAQPTAEQDIIFSIRQLAQIAVRALSPGINDPFTAYSCIDRLIDGIGVVLQRPPLPNCFHDHQQRLRLVTTELDFADVLAAALDEIREYGSQSAVVLHHLLDALQQLAEICSREEDRRALKYCVERLAEDCEKQIDDKYDTTTIQKKINHLRTQLLP
ncbi:DUF2254 domain-containing protein [Microbulbifer bruguierae]|uniref:DUF2254 domain-containing protein n=1 Tax=Microbulbifer bruguierae TaxID=3029061 RepID=A0ABY8NFZ9_9GAMM|nr:DUF2254 domain-containing protein [Microbulbifer bruguierae]WGL17861.1 DUF2254 domain-containing protein [Microbulbifer bruguierae]